MKYTVAVMGRDNKVSNITLSKENYDRTVIKSAQTGYASDVFLGQVIAIDGVPVVHDDEIPF
jgi:hypothetical protein